MNHAEFSPSKLPRIIACPGSHSLSQNMPEKPESEFAREGTYLHTVFADYVIHSGSSTLEVTDEQRQAVTDAYTYAKPFLDASVSYDSEKQVQITSDGLVWGTLDLGIRTPDELHIIDAKFGRGVFVNATDNEQLLAYLLGYLTPEDGKRTLFIHIAQPRLDNFQCVNVTREELGVFSHKLTATLINALGPEPTFNPGPEQCRWCPAAGKCPYQLAQLQADAKEVFSVYADIEDKTVTKEQIASILEKEELILTSLKAIKQAAFLALANGEEVPGYKLIRGRQTRSWAAGVTADTLMEKIPALEDEQLYEAKMLTPAKVEKLLDKKTKNLLDEFIVKSEGKISIAPESNPKEAVKVNDPAEVFKNLIDMENDND